MFSKYRRCRSRTGTYRSIRCVWVRGHDHAHSNAGPSVWRKGFDLMRWADTTEQYDAPMPQGIASCPCHNGPIEICRAQRAGHRARAREPQQGHISPGWKPSK